MNFKACPFTRRRACKARASKPRRRPSRPSYISRSRLPVRRRLIDRPRPRSTAADRLLEREGPPRHDMPCGSVAGAGVGGVGLGRRPAPAVPAACVRRATPCGSRGRPREVRAVATSPDNLSPRRRASISHRPVCFRHPPRTCHACTRNRRAWRSPMWWVSHVTLEIRSSVDSRGSRVVAPVSFAGHSPRSLREQSTRRRARRSVQRCVTRWPS